MPIVVTETESDLAAKLAQLIEKVSDESIRDHDAFYVGVSGGSMVGFLAEGLPTITTAFSKWVVFFNDERIVPEDDPDCTFGAYQKSLIGKVALTRDQFVQIKQGVSADDVAADYQKQMARHFGSELPRFDMLLLGMGPDGHTCSLFPGHRLLRESSKWVAPIVDSPKPPPKRVTITFPVINNAKNCVFAMAGESKADMLKRVLVDKEDLPVNQVKPNSGTVTWLVDKAAAKHLNV